MTLAGPPLGAGRASPPAAPPGSMGSAMSPVLGALVRRLSLLNGAHRLSQCLAGVNALPLQILVLQLGLESLQVDLPEGTGSLVGHLL